MIHGTRRCLPFWKIQGNHSLGFWENWKWLFARDLCSFLAWWVEKIAQGDVRETGTLPAPTPPHPMCPRCRPRKAGQMVKIPFGGIFFGNVSLCAKSLQRERVSAETEARPAAFRRLAAWAEICICAWRLRIRKHICWCGHERCR